MKTTILKSISYISLFFTIIPSILVLAGKMDIETNKLIMGIAMVCWFVTAPLWMNRKKDD